jgi:hypothetical protein
MPLPIMGQSHKKKDVARKRLVYKKKKKIYNSVYLELNLEKLN